MTGDQPFVSIVVPTKDRPALLEKTLISLSGQNYPTTLYEVVVADDSGDGRYAKRPELLMSHLGELQVKVIRATRRGINAGRNQALAQSSGELVAFTDDDVEAPPVWLANLVQGYLQNIKAGCWGGPIQLRIEGEYPRLCSRCGPQCLGTNLDLGSDIAEADFVYGANMAIARDTFTRVGPFDERLAPGGDEIEWQMRHKALGGQIVYLPDAWLWHRRVQEDLRLRALIKARFRRASNSALFNRIVGNSPRNLLPLVPISLGHALRRRCWNGLLMAVAELSDTWSRMTAPRH